MEIVNVGTFSVSEIFELLLHPTNLEKLVGVHGALCFAIVREMTAPDFYHRLIKNSPTIDETTRNHIAFIVVYGDRSVYRAVIDYSPYKARYKEQGFSVSTNANVYIDTEPDQPPILPVFDQELGQWFRDDSSKVDDLNLSQKMGQASRYLMERYSVTEQALPCLLFVDGRDPTKSIIVQLSSKDPLTSLYNDALRPISQEFQDLSRFWKRRDMIKANRKRLEDANNDIHDLPGRILECNDKLKLANENAMTSIARYSIELDQWQAIKEEIEGSYDDPSVCARIEHHPVAWQIIDKLRIYQNRLTEAETIEKKLLLASQDETLSPGQFYLERARLEKRLRGVRQSIGSIPANISSFLIDAIQGLKQAISQDKDKLDLLTRGKETLERQLNEARTILRNHSSETIDEDERQLANHAQLLRSRGYGDDVLVDSSAFSVIKSLQDKKLLGTNEPLLYPGGRNAMRILFLAANPFQTSSLDLEEEQRSLEQELRGVKFRDSITLTARHAVRPDDLIRYVRADKPNVIHFSGHGSTIGIILRDDTGGYQAIEGANLKRFLEGRGVDLVVLNACYSKGQADTILSAVKTVVGTTDAVGDEAARRFSVAFYRSLGDGLSVREAFRDGGDAVALHGLVDVYHSGGDLELVFVREANS